MRKKVYCFFYCLYIIIAMFSLNACSSNDSGSKPKISNGNEIAVMPTTTGETEQTSEKESEAVQGIVLDVDTDKQTITIVKTGSQDKTVYNYNGATGIYDRFGKLITIESLTVGEVVSWESADSGNKLKQINISDSEWRLTGVSDFTINTEKNTFSYGSKTFAYDENLVISYKSSQEKLDKLEPVDKLTLIGYENTIDSIIVETGHGYVRLDSTTYFEGGYIEIGPKIVDVITENMVLPVPAGTYTLTVTKDKTVGTKDITVNDNEEIRVNLIEFQSEAVRNGSVLFKIQPTGAELTVDGKTYDITKVNDFSYGKHKVVITKEGYSTFTETIDVADIYKEYDITLVESQETSAADSQTNSGSSTENGTSSSTGNETGNETTSAGSSNEDTTSATTKSVIDSLMEEADKIDETTTYDWYSAVSDLLN